MAEAGPKPVGRFPEQRKQKVRWVLPHNLSSMAFVGKEVVAVVQDVYILFLNLKTYTEIVYVADNEERGDGVDVICGQRSNIFVFAEKVNNARLFVMKYPTFEIVAEIKDPEVNRYKGVCMMEGDLVAGFSGFPNYVCVVWNWRTNQRLACVETGVIRRKQIYIASRTHMSVCECWGEGVIVWEVGQCYKKGFLLRRAKEEVTGWEVSEPPFVDICWTNEGSLYAIDASANMYSLSSDGIAMVSELVWNGVGAGTRTPHMCAFGNGVLIYGPDKTVRSLKRDEEKKCWKVVWSYEFENRVERLVGNCTCDAAVAWTNLGYVYRLMGDSEEKIDVQLVTIKLRYAVKIQLLAPDYQYVLVMNKQAMLAVYDAYTAQLIRIKYIDANDVKFEVSPVENVVAVTGAVTGNYGIGLYTYEKSVGMKQVAKACLTHQIVSKVSFSETGRELVVGAMSAGHIFIYQLSEDYKLTLIRYTELGRGLADLFLLKIGFAMRCFSLVLFSEKYSIGERVICINAETGKDNKFAGKMQGPYSQLSPCGAQDTLVGVPHLSRQYHVLKLSGEKGVSVQVKMGPIIDTGHEVKQFQAYFGKNMFLTYSYDGTVILRKPDAPQDYDVKLVVTHRYESGGRGGIEQVVVDADNNYIVHRSGNRTVACVYLTQQWDLDNCVKHIPPKKLKYDEPDNLVTLMPDNYKNYLDLQEDKKVYEERMDYMHQRDDVCKSFKVLQAKLVELLEENIAEVPLHQLSLSEFNLHQEAKKERYKQAEREREIIRLETEALIKAQDKVTAWIKQTCWDTMKTQRMKLFAIFSHYQVENFAILPTQRDKWPELIQIEALRTVQMEGPAEFRPWEEPVTVEAVTEDAELAATSQLGGVSSQRNTLTDAESDRAPVEETDAPQLTSYALSGSSSHRFIDVPPFVIPQTLAYSFLHMNWSHHITKLVTQNLRLWFNKQFDDLMALKVREVGLVNERNARLRFIVEELNKLSDLRGSYHHLLVEIKDPEWKQEEHTHKLIKVEAEECSIEPYISPSQIVIPVPDPGPKDDFKERALMDMMDGVLEKLWHEEIKKPIPMPQCMLDKNPDNFNEDDLRLVFDYEAKVAFRNQERDKYRKMLHAEYAKLSATLNEGVVKFNQKVKETWLLKLNIDSVIGQENLKLLRLRRTNLDRIEMAETIEKYRDEIATLENALEVLNSEMQEIQAQALDAQAAYEMYTTKDRSLEKNFKNHFADLSPIIGDQCYKFFKKRPKWHQRASMTPAVLYELAQSVFTGVRSNMLHPDCVDYFKAMEQLDLITNMPAVMDEQLWATMCKLRRAKVENEIRMRATAQEVSCVEYTFQLWSRAIQARRTALAAAHAKITAHRSEEEAAARNRTIQLVLPAGQVEIITTGHIEDYEDATLIPREDIEKINNLILKVGALKLRMMRKQMDFRKGILAKEWEHAYMKMKLRHMEQELYTYKRLKIPKELQKYLKEKEKGFTDEIDYVNLEKEMESDRVSADKALQAVMQKVQEVEVNIINLDNQVEAVDKLILNLHLKVSEKKLNEDALAPIRFRRICKNRMQTLVARSQLIREVQANHSIIVMLQTELELLRLKTYPTLASFRELH